MGDMQDRCVEPMTTSLLSVSSLNQLARQVLEGALGTVEVMGEVSTLRRPSSGHQYFVLKDEAAQVRCAFFRQQVMRSAYRPEEGDQVIVTAEVTLYESRGDYQLVVRSVQPAGGGRLAQLFEALKRKLDAEGLFDPSRKRALPAMPRRVAVISSPTGAAIQDVLSVLRRRMPLVEVLLYPVAVQGSEAAGQLCSAMQSITADDGYDVVLVVRGGGSIEDLWPFNDETLARAIAACPIPVVSGVGHEIDFTISDFVADHRAATPTAAAEMVTPVPLEELLRQIEQGSGRLEHGFRLRLERQMQRLDRLQQAVLHRGPRQQLAQMEHRRAQWQARLVAASRQTAHAANGRLVRLERRLAQVSPQQWLRQGDLKLSMLRRRLDAVSPEHHTNRGIQRLERLQERLQRTIRGRWQRHQEALNLHLQTLKSINPDHVLARGYALVTSEGALVKEAQMLADADGVRIPHVEIRFHDGRIRAQVEGRADLDQDTKALRDE